MSYENMDDLIMTEARALVSPHLRLNQVECFNMHLIKQLRQGKLMPAFRTFSHSTLYRRRATRTGKRSTICYVEGKTAFRAFHYVLRLRIHFCTAFPNSTVERNFKNLSEGDNLSIYRSFNSFKGNQIL
jgi:hypothetical protein